MRRCHGSFCSPINPHLHAGKLGPAVFTLREMASELAALSSSPQKLRDEDEEAFFSPLRPLHQQRRGYEHTSESQEGTLSNERGTEKPLLGP